MALFDRLFGKKKNADTPLPEERDDVDGMDDDSADAKPFASPSATRRFSLSSGRVLGDPSDTGAFNLPSGDSQRLNAPPSADVDPSAEERDPVLFPSTRPVPTPEPLAFEDDPLLADPTPVPDTVPLPQGAATPPPNADTVRHLPPRPAPGAVLGGVPLTAGTPAQSHKVRVSAKNKMLGAVLESMGVVTGAQVEEALGRQQADGGLIGQWLVRLMYATAEDVAAALGKQRTITTVSLRHVPVDPELRKMFTRSFCLKHRVLPFERLGDSMVCVAMTNVLDTAAKNAVREHAAGMVKPFDAEWSDLQGAIDRWFGDGGAGTLTIELPGDDDRQKRRIAAIKPASGPDETASMPTPAPEAEEPSTKPARPSDSERRAVEALHLQALPDDEMPAIPLTESYVSEVVQWGLADPERRWLATHLVDNVLPLLPAPDVAQDDAAS